MVGPAVRSEYCVMIVLYYVIMYALKIFCTHQDAFVLPAVTTAAWLYKSMDGTVSTPGTRIVKGVAKSYFKSVFV